MSTRRTLVAAAAVVLLAGMHAAAPIVVPLLLAVFLAVNLTPVFLGLSRRGLPAFAALLLLAAGLGRRRRARLPHRERRPGRPRREAAAYGDALATLAASQPLRGRLTTEDTEITEDVKAPCPP